MHIFDSENNRLGYHLFSLEAAGSMHDRDSFDDFSSILNEFDNLPPIVMHWGGGNNAEAEAYISRLDS